MKITPNELIKICKRNGYDPDKTKISILGADIQYIGFDEHNIYLEEDPATLDEYECFVKVNY